MCCFFLLSIIMVAIHMATYALSRIYWYLLVPRNGIDTRCLLVFKAVFRVLVHWLRCSPRITESNQRPLDMLSICCQRVLMHRMLMYC